jgi:plasmid stabilization system protein ParE
VKWRITIRPRAEADLQEARQWYNRQRAGLGDELLNVIDDVMVVLQKNPERHPVYYRGFRRAITRRFPYKIFYRIEGNSVIVFRILHARRDHPPLLES